LHLDFREAIVQIARLDGNQGFPVGIYNFQGRPVLLLRNGLITFNKKTFLDLGFLEILDGGIVKNEISKIRVPLEKIAKMLLPMRGYTMRVIPDYGPNSGLDLNSPLASE
jgi:hypothetical protein